MAFFTKNMYPVPVPLTPEFSVNTAVKDTYKCVLKVFPEFNSFVSGLIQFDGTKLFGQI
jgi:hypothetical protein